MEREKELADMGQAESKINVRKEQIQKALVSTHEEIVEKIEELHVS
jgi:hypothetical protein